MSRIILYIATSLDGYIADKNGELHWLMQFNQPDEDYGYKALYARMGAVVMGGTTFRQVLTFGEWPYPDAPAYVMTRQPTPAMFGATIKVFAGDVTDLVSQIRHETDPNKDIWLVGGGDINAQFARAGLIDELILSIMPLAIGQGIALFTGTPLNMPLKLAASRTYPNGVVQLTYTKP